jgi:uncharacterized protein YggE
VPIPSGNSSSRKRRWILLSEAGGRRIYYLAAMAIVAIVLISAITVTRPLSAQNPGTSVPPKTIQVTGIGTVSAAPDQAILLLAVQTQAATATQAGSDNAAIMTKVMDSLVALGISKDSIQTISYSLTPMVAPTQDQTTPPKIVGYQANNAISVTINNLQSNLALIGKALDTAISAGVNEVQGVMFSLSDSAQSALEKQALQIALQDADSKANAIATSLKLTIVGPISVSPGYIFQPAMRELSAGAAQTPIEPGTLNVSVNVQVTYQFA